MCVEMHWILNFIKTYNMKILQVAFLLLFNYLDSLPKLYIYKSDTNTHTYIHIHTCIYMK